MLIITIELLPGGSEALRRPIASMCIANEAGHAEVAGYQVTAMESANPLAGALPGFADAKISAHDRRQRVWWLVRRACEEIGKAGWIPLEAEDCGQI